MLSTFLGRTISNNELSTCPSSVLVRMNVSSIFPVSLKGVLQPIFCIDTNKHSDRKFCKIYLKIYFFEMF